MVSSLANRLKWFIMYFILLTVRSIVLVMSSTSLEVYQVKKRTWKVKIRVIYFSYFLMAASILTINILDSIYKDSPRMQQLLYLSELGVKLIIFCIDVYMVKIFIQIVRFYRQTRDSGSKKHIMRTSLNLETSHDMETDTNTTITAYEAEKLKSKVFFAIVVMIMHIIDSLLSLIAPLKDIMISDQRGKETFSLLTYLIRTMIDILTATGFQYLAYSVTMKRLQIEQ
jgi:hypothetical protein